MAQIRIQVAFFSIILFQSVPFIVFEKSQLSLYLLVILGGLFFLITLFSWEKVSMVNGENPGRDLIAVSSIALKKNTYRAIQVLAYFLLVNFQYFKIDPDGNGFLTIMLTVAVMTIAVAEEYTFRFSIQGNLTRLGLPLYKVILISSGLFALSHSLIGPFPKPFTVYGLINQVIFDYSLGILLGALFYLTKSLLFVALYHFFATLPATVGRLRSGEPGWEYSMTGQPIEHSLSGCLWFMLFISPLILVSLYYLWKVTRKQVGGKRMIKA